MIVKCSNADKTFGGIHLISGQTFMKKWVLMENSRKFESGIRMSVLKSLNCYGHLSEKLEHLIGLTMPRVGQVASTQ